jgi:hypothetical protein
MILTSNRVGQIDEAFRSRIHICLFYPKLDKSSVMEIWEKNIARVKSSDLGIDIDEDDVRHFYELLWLENEKNPSRHWNGRQIKNAFQTAIALAHWDFQGMSEDSRPPRPLLRAKHFKRVGQTSAHFDDYIGSVYGIEEQDAYGVLAAREEIRRDMAPAASFMNSRESKARYRSTKGRLSRRNTPQDRSTHFDDSNDSSEEDDMDDDDDTGDDEIEKLKLKHEIEKLKKKFLKGGKKG